MRPAKKIHTITKWSDMKLIFHEDRKKIIDLCGKAPSSIKDLARALNLNPGSIHNHVHKLHQAGYLEITETREINGIIEKKYFRSAEFFNFAELQGEENVTRNKFIAKDIMGEVFDLLEDDREAIARITKVSLSSKHYKEARQRLNELITYLKTHNNSGDQIVSLISCLGKKGRL